MTRSLLIPTLGTILWLTACDNPSKPSETGAKDSQDAYDELKKLPDFESKMQGYVYRSPGSYPEDALEQAPPKFTVKRVNKDLFTIRVEYGFTAMADIYSSDLRLGDWGSLHITEFLDSKGDRKVIYKDFEVRYGPRYRKTNTGPVEWYWGGNSEISGDDLEPYHFHKVRTAEALGINREGTASSYPDVLIRDTPEHAKAVAAYPGLERTETERMKVLDQIGQDQMTRMKDKKQLDGELREHFKKHFGQ